MKIGILGATSQIARDFVMQIGSRFRCELYLFARDPERIQEAFPKSNLQSVIGSIGDYSSFSTNFKLDAILNFVGVGNPARALAMGSDIFQVTQHFDQLALEYLKFHSNCRYIFMSSGAVYGSSFFHPVTESSKSKVGINSITSNDWYGLAKLAAEYRHRAHYDIPIVDLRIFNYFSETQDINARFLISEALKAIKSGSTLLTSSENIVRDYLNPTDFTNIIECILRAPASNDVIDAYSLAPIDKFTLLNELRNQFALEYKIDERYSKINATGEKLNYFSLNRRAVRYGYSPIMNSLEAVLDGARKIL